MPAGRHMPEKPIRQADEDGSSGRELSFKSFMALAGMAFLATWGIVWIYIAAFPMAYEGRDYPLVIAKNQLLAQCWPDSVVVFGDSRATVGVLPTSMHVPVANLAFPAASPVETYFLVTRLLRCPTPPRLVIIAHSASMYPKDEYFWSVFAGTGMLTNAEIRTVVADAHGLGDDELEHAEHSSAVPYALLPALYAMRFPPLYFANLLNGYVAARWRYNERVVHQTIIESGRSSFGTADGSDAIADEAKMTNWQVSPLINLYMNRTLSLLAARHVPVVIMTMPINAATCKRLPAAIQPRFSAYLAGIARAHPNVEAVDSTIACWPDRLYGDASHFNMAGTLAYSQQLQAVIATLLNNGGTSFPPHDQKVVAALQGVPLQPSIGAQSPND